MASYAGISRGPASSSNILGMSDCFKVIRIGAGSIFTEMVDFHLVWDDSFPVFIT